MKSNIPWSVKGIDPEAREAAKVAARRAGMTLGEWLNSLILQSGELPEGLADQLAAMAQEEDEREAAARDDADAYADRRSYLDEADEEEDDGAGRGAEYDRIQARLEALNQRMEQTERRSAMTVSGIDQSIERLASTIENSRRLLTAGDPVQRSLVSDLAARVDRLQSQLEKVATQGSGSGGMDPRTLQALERAIAGVASHIEKSDRRNSELVKSVEDALQQFEERVDESETRHSDISERTEHAIERMSNRVDAAEAEQRRSSTRLNERLSQIDERISSATNAQENSLSGLERRFSSLEAKMQNMQTRLDSTASRFDIPNDTVSRSELEELSRRVGLLAAAAGGDTSGLQDAVSTIESRLSDIVERIDRLQGETRTEIQEAEHIAQQALHAAQSATEQTPAPVSLADDPALNEVRTQVEAIAARFERSNNTATETMSALEGVLRSLTRRLDAVESKAPAPTPQPFVPPAPEARGPAEQEAAAAAGERVLEQVEEESPLPAAPRPGWTWGGFGRRGMEAREEPEPEEPDEIPAEAAEDEEDIVEVVEEEPAEDDVVEATSSEDEFEAVLEPEMEPEDDIVVEADEADDYDGSERPVQLSDLDFDLGPAGAENERSDWRSDEDEIVEALERDEDDYAESRDRDNDDSGGWLEQARRAAKAAAPVDRASEFGLEDDEPSALKNMMLIIVLLVLLGLAAAGVWFFGIPWAKEQGLIGGGTPIERNVPAEEPEVAAADAAPEATDMAPEAPAPLAPELTAPPTEEVAEPAPEAEAPAAAEETEAAAEEAPDEAAEASAAEPEEAPAPEEAEAAPPDTPFGAQQAAAEAGDAQAQFGLALSYKNGVGVSPDPDLAVEWMTRAANQDLAVAQRFLGIWYEQGEGVPKNLSTARQWYERAAEGGDVQAMHNLGYFYAKGEGDLPVEIPSAERWFRRAAERGLVESQVNLAIIYGQGASFGIETQMDQAYFWISLAAARGDQGAVEIKEDIAAQLPAGMQTQLDREVAEWTPEPSDLVANGGFDASQEAFLPEGQRPGLSRSELITVQELLNELGFDAGPADGRPGSQTRAAIGAFQSAYGLPQTGEADRNLLAALNAVPR